MSDSENNEYEVESILQARVEKKRGKQLIMKFNVRWKGYSEDDDTWEPMESFEESEGIIERFWERVNSDGRDFRNMQLFKAGEVFMPMGPPRRKRKRDVMTSEQSKSTPSAPAGTNDKSGSGKAQEHTERHVDERPSKRNRKQLRKVRSLPTSEASDEDRQEVVNRTPHRTPRRAARRVVASPEYIPPSDEADNAIQDGNLFGSPVQSDNDHDVPVSPSPPRADKDTENSPNVSTPTIKKPSHRLAKPLIRFQDQPYLPAMGSAIAVKARITGLRTSDGDTANEPKNSSAAAPSKPVPAPVRSSVGLKKNKSSLLTFEKGSLKTVKGSYAKAEKAIRNEPETISADISDNVPATQSPAPPEPSELLQLAGVDTQGADTLPSYEESVMRDDSSLEKPLDQQGRDRLQSLNDAKDKLLPSGSAITVPESASVVWRRSTIFDPLTRGLTPDNGNELATKVPGLFPFWLALDISCSVPIHLSSSAARPVDAMSRKSMRPGVFYKGVHALDIFRFVHTDGPPGIVTVDPGAKDEDKGHYEHFRTRLSHGDLFVIPAGIDVLAFWSADNATLTQHLNVPDPLNKPGNLLFSKIIVDNYSEYSEFVANADPIPWLQCMATVQ